MELFLRFQQNKSIIKNEKLTVFIALFLLVGAIASYILFYNRISSIEKIAKLDIPASASVIERQISSNDFDGGSESLFVIRLNDKEYDYIMKQCVEQNYNSPPIPNLDIAYLGLYIEKRDTIIYKLHTFNPPDYSFTILNISKEILIVKQVNQYGK